MKYFYWTGLLPVPSSWSGTYQQRLYLQKQNIFYIVNLGDSKNKLLTIVQKNQPGSLFTLSCKMSLH